ncbi:GntR family transcriptional regulator [Orrella sp. NBD-18]|uniref:GntR family transcriptional regulator n=1 Tax=Sheuella amnicola TaxID=2707330 RepID=A0A6B2QZQ7_9BURK|nr:GntR family transcriptional regulator [Sheuella amnicola]NDY82649.1 GntR family transcriptional regulator [Sheuella amnicola]HBI83665.1 GntR family transcriptional regulator [Alcaligenaceae bacterium]
MSDFSSRSAADAGEQRQVAAAFSPLYQQIKALLVQSLERGEWKPGEAIPSEIELAARFQVSQGTVRKAVDELAAEHLLMRRQGKGTFVSTHHEARVRFRFLRLAPIEGEPQPAESRILDCKRMRANAEMARSLELKAGDPIVAIRRLLSFSGVPTVVDDIFLPGVLFKGLTAELLGGYVGPLYGFFETEFGISMVRAEEKLRAVAADPEISVLLKVDAGTPLLRAERISYTYANRPVELRIGHYVTDGYYYRNSLN